MPGPATHFDVFALSVADNGTPTAVLVTARDADDAVANTYAGTVTFSSTDATATLPLPLNSPLLAGVGNEHA